MNVTLTWLWFVGLGEKCNYREEIQFGTYWDIVSSLEDEWGKDIIKKLTPKSGPWCDAVDDAVLCHVSNSSSFYIA